LVTTETNYLEWLKKHFEESNYWVNMGITFDYLEKGDVRVKLVVADRVLNINNTLHGGAIASLMDVSISTTLRSIRSDPVTTVSLTTNFINPAKQGKTVYATASITSSKNRIQYVESTVVDEDGVIIANGVGVFSFLKSEKQNQ
jgi:acyl-CoA thioesterase